MVRESRKTHRYSVNLTTEFVYQDNKGTCDVLNISHNGLLLKMPMKLRQNETVALNFDLNDFSASVDVVVAYTHRSYAGVILKEENESLSKALYQHFQNNWYAIDNSPKTTFFNSNLWDNALQQSFSNVSCNFISSASVPLSNNGITLYEINSLLTGKRLTTFPFHSFSELIVDNADEMERIIQNTISYARKKNIHRIEISALTRKYDQLFQKYGFYTNRYYFLPILELQESYAALCSKYKKNFLNNLTYIKRKIKKELQLEFVVSNETENLSGFYKLLLHEHKKKHSNIPPPFDFLKNLMDMDKTGQSTKLFVLKENGSIVAGALILFHENTAHYGWSAVDLNYEKWSVLTYLVDRVIEYLCDSGVESFCLGPVSPHNKGLLFFKSRWGAKFYQPHVYTLLTGNQTNKALDEAKDFKTCRKFVHYLPDFIFNILIKKVYKHLAEVLMVLMTGEYLASI